MGDNYRVVQVVVLEEHEEAMARLQMVLAPHKVDDAGLFQIALSSIGNLIQRAEVIGCPHAKHALAHIGLGGFLPGEPSKSRH